MTASTSSASTGHDNKRHTKSILIGLVTVLVFTALAVAGSRWWQERNALSQASKADCALAQELIDESQGLPTDKTAIDTWEKAVQQRRAQLQDGYLAFNISNYNGVAAAQAKGEDTPPLKKFVQDVSDKANGHCVDAGVTLVFPSLTS